MVSCGVSCGSLFLIVRRNQETPGIGAGICRGPYPGTRRLELYFFGRGDILAHKDIEQAVEDMLTPRLEAEGIEIVDVEYVRERNWILRLYIDKEGGVDLTDCQTVSEEAGRLLDEKDLIPDNYMLEVSSPGVERVIKKDKDFLRFAGSDVDVKLFAPLVEGKKETKNFTAKLKGLSEEKAIVLVMEDGNEVELPKDKVSQVRLHFTF